MAEESQKDHGPEVFLQVHRVNYRGSRASQDVQEEGKSDTQVVTNGDRRAVFSELYEPNLGILQLFPPSQFRKALTQMAPLQKQRIITPTQRVREDVFTPEKTFAHALSP